MTKHPTPPNIDTTDFFQGVDSETVGNIMPEKRLLIAMIHRALLDYTIPVKGKAHLQYDAGKWLFSANKTTMSLWWVCDAISESPRELQKRIQIAARTKAIKITGVMVRVDTK